MIRALCGFNETFDKDVTIVLALNRISALIGIFFGNALRYVYFGCLSSIERRLTKMCMRNFEVSLNFYNKGINYALTEDFLDASEKFLSLIRFANDLYILYNQLNAIRLARFRKNMKTCESVKRNAELFL